MMMCVFGGGGVGGGSGTDPSLRWKSNPDGVDISIYKGDN